MFWKSIFDCAEDFQCFQENINCWNRDHWNSGPRTATIMITERCNYKCNYCWFKTNSYVGELPVNAWMRIIDELADLNVVRITFTGGEPLLYESLTALISHARDRGVGTTIVSNGSLATGNKINELIEAGLGSFIVSIDTINKDLYSFMTGTSDTTYDQVLNSISILKNSASCWSGIICVLSPQIISSLADLLSYCKMHNIHIYFQPFLETCDMPALSITQAKHALDIIKNAQSTGTFVLNSAEFLESIVEFSLTNKKSHKTLCVLPFHEIYLNPDGTVKACCLSDEVGDIKTSSINQIWESDNYKSWRQKAVDGVCFNCLLISHELMPYRSLTVKRQTE